MNSRQNILQRLRQYRSSNPVTATSESGSVGVVQVANKPEAFITAMEAAHGEIIRTSISRWQQDLFKHLQSQSINNLMVAGKGRFTEALLSNEANHSAIEVITYDQEIEGIKEQLFHRVEAGFSIAAAGIAETGTLILKTGPTEPRTLSLVPPVSYVWLNVDTLYQNQTEAFADKDKMLPLPTNLLLISGPSKTADIQQTLAYGAHGPKRLIILLVED
ncbi:LutC/YkgG family protein [Hahella ganghwensis]|uniref:LutC/YkgG family protein n=1 Tax=Hahella ganghwensis TaxID=286420 RepID=UPI00036C4FFF|nr:lactate utilization protein C [Hahella ganghwensis]